MIYVTGDLHGDIERFKDREYKKLKYGDTLIVCGDFGFIWDNSKEELKNLEKLEKKKFNICFIDGCHENFDLLESYPLVEWNGGQVRKIRNNIFHLTRGQIFNIENKKIFTFGGGHSQDYEFRYENKWWKQEQPTHEEILTAVHNLEKYDNSVDYIITHEPPASLKDCLGVDIFERLEIHTFFEDVIKAVNFRKWFFGKCHVDRHIPVKFFAVFEDVLPL